MSVIITGSLAFDHIMNFKGNFADYILPEKTHQINLSFAVETLRKERGGCAGNIAYNLSLLDEKPIILATAGEDFSEYKKWLESKRIDTRFIRLIHGEMTALGFGITDAADNQIWGFYPGAMNFAKDLSLNDIFTKEESKDNLVKSSSGFGLPRFGASRFGGAKPSSFANSAFKNETPPAKTSGIFSSEEDKEEEEQEYKPPTLNREEIKLLMIAPGNPQAMMRLAFEAKALHLPYIFDPGMQIPQFNRDNLLKAIDGAKVLIGNDYEIALIEEMLNAKKEHLIRLVEYLIITQGGKGSLIFKEDKGIEIPPVIPKSVIDPTGAGDAYRAGIIYGLLNKMPVEKMGRIGSLLATYTVEKYGTTTHEFKIIEFKKRFSESFGEKLEL